MVVSFRFFSTSLYCASDDDISIESTHTLTNENLNDLDKPLKKKNNNSSESGSPPSVNSISLPPTPVDTPIPLRKIQMKKRNCDGTKSVNGKPRRNKLRDVSPVREENIGGGADGDGGGGDYEDDTETDTDSLKRIGDRRTKVLSVSNATLTNVRTLLLYDCVFFFNA